jgi:hypothetical protein
MQHNNDNVITLSILSAINTNNNYFNELLDTFMTFYVFLL